MLIGVEAFRMQVRAALIPLSMWSMAAEELLLGTAVKESHLGGLGLRQIGGGPARGVLQMEPATMVDIWVSYLRYRPDLAAAVAAVTGVTGPDELHLEYNVIYDIVMARLHYRRVKEALPQVGDLDGQARYWDGYYNKNPDAGFAWEYVELYREMVVRREHSAIEPCL